MKAQTPSTTSLLDGMPAQRILEGLSRLHRWMLVIDERRRVVWMSDALDEIPGIDALAVGDDARSFVAKLPKPEQLFGLRSGMRGRGRLVGFPIEVRGKGGESSPVDVDLLRIPSDGGDMIIVVASERASTRASGHDAELIEAMPDAVLTVDADGFVRRVNASASRLLAAGADDLLGRSVTGLLEPVADQFEALADVLQGPARDARCEIRLRSGSGAFRAFDVSAAPLPGGARVLVLRDFSVQSRRIQQLIRSNEELDHGIGALAHDLRSPLLGLLGFSRLLREDYADTLDETGRHFLDRIDQAGRTMQALIQDLLELARVGEPGQGPELVDWQGVLRQLAAEIKPRLEEARIELSLPDAGASRIYCDRSRLYQVFSNLIGNAIDHMGPRPFARIEVNVEEDDEGHEITVSDNGQGVDAADRERIFQIFQSVGTSTDGRIGTGMGLAIVKKIVERRGGRIWVDEGPQGGACFHATFPRR